jgi:hypothetical protein
LTLPGLEFEFLDRQARSQFLEKWLGFCDVGIEFFKRRLFGFEENQEKSQVIPAVPTMHVVPSVH